MKLLMPAFHFSVASGYRSPKAVMESVMLPMRIAANCPKPVVSVPSIEVADRPNRPVMPIASCPPSTGLANV
jgi:hypothetical protein